MRFKSPPPRDPAAERAIMGASAVTPKFDTLATTAIAILAQVCTDQTVAAERVGETMISMVSRGALEWEDASVAVRFEHLTCENRARIRASQWGFDWPPKVATVTQEPLEPWLPVAIFLPSMQEALRYCLEEGVIMPRMRGDESMIAESDYLPCHQASIEGPFLPLTAFSENPPFIKLLLAAHAAELVVRNGRVCVPWQVVNDYAATGASPLDWELDPHAIPICGPA